MFSYVVFILTSIHFCTSRSFLATDDPLGPLDSVLLMTIWTWCSSWAITISLLVPCAGNQDGESKLKIALWFCNECLKQPSWDVRWKYLQVYAADSPNNYHCARVAKQGNRKLKEAARSSAVRSCIYKCGCVELTQKNLSRASSLLQTSRVNLQKLPTCRSRTAPSRTDPPTDQGTPWLEVFAATPQILSFTPPNVRAHFC